MTGSSASGATEPLVDMDQVKERLNFDPEDNGSDDAELSLYLASATEVLVGLYGDVLPRSYTETVRPFGDGTHALLGRSPVLSVESVYVRWVGSSLPAQVLAPSMYRIDGGAGVLESVGGTYRLHFGHHAELIVSYTVGRATVTAAVQDAVLEILRVNWRPQRAGYNPATGEAPMEAGFTHLGYFIPNSAHERLAPGSRPRQMA